MKTKQKEKLKSCPFCGGKAYMYFVEGYYWAHCTNKECEATRLGFNTRNEDSAIKAWNKRAKV